MLAVVPTPTLNTSQTAAQLTTGLFCRLPCANDFENKRNKFNCLNLLHFMAVTRRIIVRISKER
jgi:hypothetical protein